METIDSRDEYFEFVKQIKDKIYKAQYEALRALNKELINLYWEIGKEIVIQQNEKGWGKAIVEILAKELQNEFPRIRGFSTRNLWNMRKFYTIYVDNLILQPLVAEISWTKNTIIMEKCKDNLEREFYIKMTKKFGWTKNVLIHQIENKSYEKYLLNQTSFDSSLPNELVHQAKLAVKDEYTFDFIELSQEHSEKELEASLVNNIRRFLTEMGNYFAFIGSQYRIEIDGEEYFIDLLLYHRKLKSLIAIELKITAFKPEHAGKMQFYLSVLDDKVKLPEENPSIGIIICKSKNRTTVEYALKDSSKPIGVSTYKILNSLPESLKAYLPSPQEISERISKIDF